jgi:hypothetical protein
VPPTSACTDAAPRAWITFMSRPYLSKSFKSSASQTVALVAAIAS